MTYEIVTYTHFWEMVDYAHHYYEIGLSERARVISDSTDFWFEWEQICKEDD